jgi:hypothetical protein
MAVFLTSRIAASQFRDVAGFRLPVDARRHMRPLRPGILFIAVQENSGLENSLTLCQTLARQIPSSPKRQMVTNDNRFAKLAVPPSEKRGSSAATLKSKIFDDTPCQ